MKLIKFFLINLFFSLILVGGGALANGKECSLFKFSAKGENINGQSDIPKNPYVTASVDKVFFYSLPNESCRSGNVFVVLGDYLYAYKKYNDFTYVNYVTLSGDNVFGWVKSANIKNYSLLENRYKKTFLNIMDFIVISEDGWFGLGDSILNNTGLSKKKELFSNYIGDFPNDHGGLNKFYYHSYSGFSIITSNVGYNKRLWSIDDDYIISEISVMSMKYKTNRGIKIGDSIDDVLNAYKEVKNIISKDGITYKLGEMSLVFNVKEGVVNTIDVSLIPKQ